VLKGEAPLCRRCGSRFGEIAWFALDPGHYGPASQKRCKTYRNSLRAGFDDPRIALASGIRSYFACGCFARLNGRLK
jgi:hypothetical protein